MIEGWSRAGGWESFEAWKRWFLQNDGRVDPPPPHRPSVRLFGVYRVFSAPEGIQTEVEVAGVEPAAVAAAEREVRWRARAFLAKQQKYLSDPNPHGGSVVFLQVSFEASPGRWPTLAYGDMAAPPSAPRRSVGELVALALEDLGG
jgi:hypothetical protein